MSNLDALVEFAVNPDPRCACVLLLDTSYSMSGSPLLKLNEGLQVFRDDLSGDKLACQRVEVAIVTFGEQVQLVQDFVTAGSFVAPTLEASGETPMGAAINYAVDLVERRKNQYKSAGILYYRPWIFMITDGAPTDDWTPAAARIKANEASGSVAFFAVGVHPADIETLNQISARPPVRLDGMRFRELFLWLSQSQKRVSGSKPGEQTPLPELGWASV